MGFEEYCGTYQDHWTYQGEPGERICEDTSNGEHETKGIYEKNEDARDGNNNSSPALFSEEEIHGRGRGLVAKVKLDNFFRFLFHIFSIKSETAFLRER